MAGKKGRSGKTYSTMLSDALRTAMLREAETRDKDGHRRTRVTAMAEELAKRAETGQDDTAIAFVFDRLEGKARPAPESDETEVATHEEALSQAGEAFTDAFAQMAERNSQADPQGTPDKPLH